MDLNANPEHGIQLTEAVKQLQILHTPPEQAFDNITQLATVICGMPAAAIIFADGTGGWIKAAHGISLNHIEGFQVLLDNTLSDSLLILNHESTAELSKNFLAALRPFNFYAGIAIVDDADVIVGHLCVLDYHEQTLTMQQLQGLKLLGTQVSLLVKDRKQNNQPMLSQQFSTINWEQIRNIFYNSVNGVIILDNQNTIIHWNSKAENIFGWSLNEITGKTFAHHCIAEPYRQQYLNNDGCAGEHLDAVGLHKNGSLIGLNIGQSSVTINDQGYCIAFVTDVTERNHTTSKLDKQKEFYENILNKLPTDIAVFDANHRYLFVNPGAISNAEYRKFIIGKDDYEYAAYRNRDNSIADTRRARFLQVKENGKEIRWEDSLPNPEGKTITHLRRLFPVHDENGELTMVIGFGMDITERKIMEEKQALLVKQLSAQNAQLTDFCNIVSHNLRGPLVNMSMLVEFIEETDDSDEQKFLISKLQPVVDNLHNTFNELVESIQIKQDWEVQSEKLNLQAYVQRTIEGVKAEIDSTEAVVECDFSEVSEVYYPPKYLSSIFHNLIGNSLKYYSPNRKPVIKISAKRNGNNVILSVSDNGLGIDVGKHKDNLFKIGKVFHRHPNAKGFGLFMTKTQVEAMDGKIWVDGVPDEGTTFFIEFKNQKAWD